MRSRHLFWWLVLVLCSAQRHVLAQDEFAATNVDLLRHADRLLAGPEPADVSELPGLSPQPKPVAHTASPARVAGFAAGSWSATLVPLLVAEGVPAEAIAVMQVESGGNPRALSGKGARGLWQLMPETARRYGLRVDVDSGRQDRLDVAADEHLDPIRSTQAAARYLRDLYTRFGSWPLALAAYNWGEQHLDQAMAESGARDFAALAAAHRLPPETRAYVPAVLALWSTARVSATDVRPVQVLYAMGRETISEDGRAIIQPAPLPTPQGN